MKWSELPKKYKDLVPKSDGECRFIGTRSVDDIMDKFIWDATPQGWKFWDACRDAKTVKDLPPITIQ